MTAAKNRDKEKRRSIIDFAPLFVRVLCGVLLALPNVWSELWPIGWIAAVPVLYGELYSPTRLRAHSRAYLHGLVFFMTYSLVSFAWLWQMYPMSFLGISKGAALAAVAAAWIILSLIQSAASALVFLLLSLLRKRLRIQKYPFAAAAAAGGAWVLAEWLQNFTFAGVPWVPLALGQTGCIANIQSASLSGEQLITFLIVAVSSLTASGIYYLRKTGKSRRAAACLAAAALLFSANYVFGTVRIIASAADDGEEITVSAVQGNISSDEKWAEKVEYTLDTYYNLTVKAADGGADMILWPETALPFDLSAAKALTSYLENTADAAGCPLICGIFETENGKLYNELAAVDPEKGVTGEKYRKQHLVPFSEYVPDLPLISGLAALSPIDNPITPGDGGGVLRFGEIRVGCLICFDDIFSETCRERVLDGAEIICVATNDSWFDGSAASEQHLSHAMLRAAENGRYVIRAANTGISAVISETGQPAELLAAGGDGVCTAKARLSDETTLYTKAGAIIVYLSALWIAALLITCVIKRTEKENTDNDYRH